MFALALLATVIPSITALKWGEWYRDSSPICLGTKCPEANVFIFHYCCGTAATDCCFWIQNWVEWVLIIITVLSIISFVLSLIRCLCCSR